MTHWFLEMGEKLAPYANFIQVATFAVELIFVFVAAVAGILWYADYRRNIFRNKVSCTLNAIESVDGKHRLVLRGLYTDTVAGLFDERPIRRAFQRAIRATTSVNAFLIVSNAKMRGRINEALIMKFSTLPGIEAKVRGFLQRSDEKIQLVGVPTFEVFEDSRDHKVRPWYISTPDLERFLDPEWAALLDVEVPEHRDRIPWLIAMAQVYFTGTCALKSNVHQNAAYVRAMMHEVMI